MRNLSRVKDDKPLDKRSTLAAALKSVSLGRMGISVGKVSRV